MKNTVIKLAHSFAAAFYPSNPSCPCCGRVLFDEETILCNKCAPHVFFKPRHTCKICGRAVMGGEICSICYENKYAYEAGISMLEYNSYTAPMIQSIKYNNNTDLAYRLGMLLAYDIRSKSELLQNTHLLLAVPLHEARLRQRGYNQAEIIAQGLSKNTFFEVKNGILIKTKETKDQIGLSKVEREENLKNCFFITDPSQVKDKNILLVDDVLTTASTINACAESLKKNGANKIFFAVLASKTY
jgi:ComF family protein